MYHSTVNLPQISLPTFNGDPKLWREFWNSFKAAIHIRKSQSSRRSTYLKSCLKGEALQAIRNYDVENYEVIRQVLIQKFGNPTVIRKSLYNEYHSIKRNNKKWKSTIEAIEKTLRQLQAIGEKLKHFSIETVI